MPIKTVFVNPVTYGDDCDVHSDIIDNDTDSDDERMEIGVYQASHPETPFMNTQHYNIVLMIWFQSCWIQVINPWYAQIIPQISESVQLIWLTWISWNIPMMLKETTLGNGTSVNRIQFHFKHGTLKKRKLTSQTFAAWQT